MSMTISYGARRVLANMLMMTLLACSVAAVSRAEARTVRIVVLGDSIAAGYGLSAPDGFQAVMEAALRATGRDVRLVDAAVSGDTSAGGLARLDWALATPELSGAPFGVLVELGGNDGLRALPVAELERNLTAILDRLQAAHIPVMMTGMLAPPNMGRAYADGFAAVFQRLGARPGVIFDPFILDGVAGDGALNQPDNIHPNPAGVRKLTSRMLPAMQRLTDEVAAVP